MNSFIDPPTNQASGDGTGTSKTAIELFRQALSQRYQYYLDQSSPHMLGRWIFFAVLVAIYMIRVTSLQAFYIVTYGLAIFLLNNFIGFLTPLNDADLDVGDGNVSLLPLSSKDEFRPFVRRLPEFKFWYACTKAVLIAFVMTFFSVLNIPVFWPILVMYFLVLFAVTMKRQIQHMIKHKYVPFSFGKQTYQQGEIRMK